ncbi:MAG: patatin-like phospholipase family protein [Thermoleophilaceae bacterium]
MAERVNVLAIDGGGMRGIIPALVLADLEERTGRPTAGLFELIAGTSTGGLLALALTRPNPRPAAELVDLYVEEGPRIFSRSLKRRILSLGGLLDERYPLKPLERALDDYLGDTRLSEALTDVLVTTYALEERRPHMFKSARARTDPKHDAPMALAGLATSAAPTYFEPVRVGDLALIDGGVYAANPAMVAYAEVRRHRPEGDTLLVSLGTGELTEPIRYEDARGWGSLEWVRPLIDVIFDGASDSVDYQLRQLLPEDRYARFQTRLGEASGELDDASEANIRALVREGEGLVAERAAELDDLARRLVV